MVDDKNSRFECVEFTRIDDIKWRKNLWHNCIRLLIGIHQVVDSLSKNSIFSLQLRNHALSFDMEISHKKLIFPDSNHFNHMKYAKEVYYQAFILGFMNSDETYQPEVQYGQLAACAAYQNS